MATNKEVQELRAIIRSAAKERSFELSGDLESFGITTIKAPPPKTTRFRGNITRSR